MAVCEGIQAIRSVFTPQLTNITLGGACTPLASGQSGPPTIGHRLFIVLIEDEVPLALFYATSQNFSEARVYKTFLSEHAGAGSSVFAIVLNSLRWTQCTAGKLNEWDNVERL